jgi:hypothetical protein
MTYKTFGILTVYCLTILLLSSLKPNQNRRAICSFSITNGYSSEDLRINNPVAARRGDGSGIYEVVQTMKNTLKIDTRFETFLVRNLDNAMAKIQNGRRMLIIDVDFLEKVNRSCGSEWCAIQIIAHEIGHHISGFQQDSHKEELTADYWSGFILAKLGSSKSAALKAMETYGSTRDSSTHPNKFKRKDAIGRGWEDGI